MYEIRILPKIYFIINLTIFIYVWNFLCKCWHWKHISCVLLILNTGAGFLFIFIERELRPRWRHTCQFYFLPIQKFWKVELLLFPAICESSNSWAKSISQMRKKTKLTFVWMGVSHSTLYFSFMILILPGNC